MKKPVRTTSVHLLFFLSGVAGLGYEIVWTRMFSVGLGHEFPSLLAVVAAFFGGFAIGAWLFDGRVSRTTRPGRAYAIMELVIAAWALVTIVAIPWANDWVADLTGLTPSPVRHWVVAFLVPLLTLLPATTAMGATLPAIDRLCCRLRQDGRSVGGLYGINTLGAVTGVLASTFYLIPAVGYIWTIVVLASINLVCVAMVMLGPGRDEVERTEVESPFEKDRPKGLAWTLVLTGMFGIGYEVIGVRVIAQVLQNTVYSFASALSVFLLGTALGGALYQRFGRSTAGDKTLALLLRALAFVCACETILLWQAGAIYEETRDGLGASLVGSVFAEFVLAMFIFLVPTILMGATFSHLAQMARETRGGVGRALALNTLGSSLGPLVFAVVLLPLLAAWFPMSGTKYTLLLIALGYLILAPRVASKLSIPIYGVIVMLIIAPYNLFLVEAASNEKIIDAKEGLMAAVTVLERTKPGQFGVADEQVRILKVNDKFHMGGTGRSEFAERRRGHVPLLLHPAPRRALFLGAGTGITMSSGVVHPGLMTEGVELLPEIVDMLPHFKEANAQDGTSALKVFTADARRFIRASRDQYDVIVADLFQPARDGSGSLYTVEHFSAVRSRLAENGLFCQWLPLYQLDLPVLKTIIRSFRQVFPEARGFIATFNVDMASLGLVASHAPLNFKPNWIGDRLSDLGLQAALNGCALDGDLYLFSCYLASPDQLATFAGEGPINTDANPVVTFSAPRFTYTLREGAEATLGAMLDAIQPDAAGLFAEGGGGSDAQAFLGRLQPYLESRDFYLRAFIARSQGQKDRMLELLFESVRTSDEFAPAYAILRETARGQVRSNPSEARRILKALIKASPGRNEAKQLYLQWFGRR